jgi:hypothetical protein
VPTIKKLALNQNVKENDYAVMDRIERRIISISVQENRKSTQVEIAEKLGISQSAVGIRLRETNVLVKGSGKLRVAGHDHVQSGPRHRRPKRAAELA